MKKSLQGFLLVLLSLPVALLLKVVKAQCSTSHSIPNKAENDTIHVVQAMRLGFERPGAHISLAHVGEEVNPKESGECLYLQDGNQARIISNLNDLHGHVSIIDGSNALRYVRLLTSQETWFLWGQGALEILEARDAVTVPDFGLDREPFAFSRLSGTRMKDALEFTRWRFNRRTQKMELYRQFVSNTTLQQGVSRTMKPSEYPLLGDGYMGILSHKAYVAGGFSPATVVPVSGGFQVTRWLYDEDQQGKVLRSVLQVKEFVGTDGTYRRTVLKKPAPPSMPHTRLEMPVFK